MTMSAAPASTPVPAATRDVAQAQALPQNSIRPAVATRHADVPKSGSSRIRPVITPDDDAQRHQRLAQVVDLVHAPLEQRRREEDDGQLGDLRRLDPEAGDAEPAACAR